MKKRNRGQDGAGMAVMKFDMPPGESYLRRMRIAGANSIDELLEKILAKSSGLCTQEQPIDENELKRLYEFLGEIYLGHVRYGTHSTNSMRCCQPYVCKNSVASKTFALAGNFNMTNSKELCEQLVACGLMPTSESDTQVILELISYCIKQEHIALAATYKDMQGKALADRIAQEIDIVQVLHNASQSWDGGYVFAGMLGNGDSFVCRDPAGIRPGFFYVNDEVIAAASERSALVNVFNVDMQEIHELKPGHVLVIKKDGSYAETLFTQPLPLRRCSFERIYFSRGADPAIYQERKALGAQLAAPVLQALGDDIENAIFAYVPNSSEYAFIGLIEELNRVTGKAVRVEKIVHKNQRLRTFIANDGNRRNLVARLYTATKGIVSPEDTLVIIDDSIVRGTTLRESIIKELSMLNPKRIIFLSSAPPVLYPDCYGIDMSQIGRFIAFQAAIALLKEKGQESLIEEIKNNCLTQKSMACEQMVNWLQKLYASCSLEELCAKIAQLARPADLAWQGDIQIIYQTIQGLHAAMPDYSGDWYFTGDYPTSGGFKVLNNSFLQWCSGCDKRAY